MIHNFAIKPLVLCKLQPPYQNLILFRHITHIFLYLFQLLKLLLHKLVHIHF